MNEPPEPSCPPGRRPHRERIADIVARCPTNGKKACVAIDDTPEHRAYYLHELRKHPEIAILSHEVMFPGCYGIKITKTHQN